MRAPRERLLHCRGGSKGGRLLGKVEAFDCNALLPEPLNIGREACELRIDARTADTGRTAHSRIEDPKSYRHRNILLDLAYEV